ncbi:Ras-related protein Rab-8A [Thelohanellus kitauei]|uniref:Ras-related protein Rab-8A n=1 Tax=Thelohanellus kitauei TaxID=669202 RepID=A0A0C2M9K0_THEKT|nr:Ras-related protein Rab-8A [Thelohanellus kitauei]
MSRFDYMFKLLLIGESAVGKTCILYRLCEDAYNHSFISTVGIDFKMKNLQIDGKIAKLQIWDTAGQERYKTITNAYYRGAMGVFIVFDLSSKSSFEKLNFWLKAVEDNCSPNVVKMILGNKCDLSDKRAVSFEDAEEFARSHDAKYIEVSAKSGTNVVEAFTSIAKTLKTLVEEQKIHFDTGHRLPLAVDKQEPSSNRSCC